LGDHGEIFNEYSRGQHSPFRRLFDLVDRLPGIRKYPRRYRLTNRFGWLGHLNALPYDLLLRVPLLIKFPEGLWRGRREPGTVQLIDLAPTILDLIGDQGNASQMLGRSILPVLRGELDSTAEYTFSDSQTHLDRVRYISVQQGDWKLIRTIHPKAANYVSFWRRLKDVAAWQHWLTPEEILVNISDEKVDHQTDRPDVYAHLNEALDAWLLSNERLASQRGLLPAEEQKLLDHLADLGYL
jgi:arylsulfatase A-like enzyme